MRTDTDIFEMGYGNDSLIFRHKPVIATTVVCNGAVCSMTQTPRVPHHGPPWSKVVERFAVF